MQAEKGALKEDLLSKADTIAQLERHVAELTTTVDFGRETQMHVRIYEKPSLA